MIDGFASFFNKGDCDHEDGNMMRIEGKNQKMMNGCIPKEKGSDVVKLAHIRFLPRGGGGK